MEVWIVEYGSDKDRKMKRFNTQEKLWGWIQEHFNDTGQYPFEMLVFQARCVFDGGVV